MPFRVILLGLVSGLSATAATPPAPEPAIVPVQVSTARRLAALQEDQIDLALVGLTLSSLNDASTDIAGGLGFVDALAKSVTSLLKNRRDDPETRILAINTVLFHENRFEYDREDPMGLNPENRQLWSLLKRRKGNCFTLPILWLAVAHRLNYPAKAVLAPHHMFVRYDDGVFRRNVEATSGGGRFSDEKMIRELEVPGAAISSGSMMRSLTKRESVLLMINDFAAQMSERGDLGIALDLNELILLHDKKSMEAHYNLALDLSKSASRVMGVRPPDKKRGRLMKESAERYARLAISHARQATALGAVPPLDDEYWKKVSGLAGEGSPISRPVEAFEVETLLQPGGSPILLRGREGLLPSAVSASMMGMLPGDFMSECAAMCGPAPGNTCALLAPRFK